MKGTGGSLSLLSRGVVELSWRYAWVLFLTFLSTGLPFPLYFAACILAISALLNLAPAKRGWQMYQVILLNSAGFMVCAFFFLHNFRYSTYPFWNIVWVDRLVRDPEGFVEWFILLLIVFCLIMIWRGGSYLKKNTGSYLSACQQFDKGLGLLFLLLIVNALCIFRLGLTGLPSNALGFLIVAYLIFGLTSIGLSRHQYDVQKSFLIGYRGIGIIFTIAALVILFGSGMVFLFYPYLFPVADTLLATLDQTTTPMVPYLIRIIRYLLAPKHEINITEVPENTETNSIELTPPPDVGWYAVVANIMVWVTMATIILMVAGILLYLLKRLFAWLLSKDSLDRPHPPTLTIWLLNLLKGLMTLAVRLWHLLVSLFKQVDSAAMVYTGLLCWGRRCGLSKKHNETPDEYGSRLVRHFPKLKQEITLIVDAFNREIYGLIKTGPAILATILTAQRQMKKVRHWPRRVKVWLLN